MDRDSIEKEVTRLVTGVELDEIDSDEAIELIMDVIDEYAGLTA